MEELSEGLFRAIARILKWIIIDLFTDVIIQGYGYATLKVITLGKLPKPGQDSEDLCIVTGLISMGVTLLLIAYFYPSEL